MRAFNILVAACLLIASVGAVDWNALRVTFGIPISGSSSDGSSTGVNGNGLTSPAFLRQPRTQDEAAAANSAGNATWAGLNPSADCSNNGAFNGIQYYDSSKPLAIVLLYDVKGTIAGIQTYMPTSEALSSIGPQFRIDLVPMFNNATINGIDYYYLTFYFVNPSTICSTGRDSSSLTADGTGTGLYIQNGTTPSQVVSVPLNRAGNNGTNGFSNNNCGSSMGWHNFYQTQRWTDTECTTIYPIFLLYNNDGELHGFGTAVRGNFSSKAYEHPGALATAVLAGSPNGDYPLCSTKMVNTFKVGTVHVYFVDKAQDFSCPLSSYAAVARVIAKYTANNIIAAATQLRDCGIRTFTGC